LRTVNAYQLFADRLAYFRCEGARPVLGFGPLSNSAFSDFELAAYLADGNLTCTVQSLNGFPIDFLAIHARSPRKLLRQEIRLRPFEIDLEWIATVEIVAFNGTERSDSHTCRDVSG
jgi:hypothetical protein